uniref:titin isoform X2 n=1 Tax=Monopterus albus TaxID=43700 RepID=UPI0009B4E849|nr:titin-like isoform X2 [Monopterus albus]
MSQLSSTVSTHAAQRKMWLIKVFSVIYFTAVCEAQDTDATPLFGYISSASPTSVTPVITTVYEPPVPLLQLKSSWLELFPSEKVELTCFISGSSDWNFIWYRDGTEIQSADPNLSADQSVLTITAATQMYSGKYACKGQHKIKGVTTQISNSLEVKVHVQPKPTLIRDPNFDMFPGESVTFTCMVSVFSEWDYLWYHNGNKIKELKTNTYTIASIAHSNSGQYHCKAKRGTGPFYTQESDKISLQISDPPTPSLSLQSPWSDVFKTEKVKLSCKVGSSSDWTFTWYHSHKKLQQDSVLKMDGSYLDIISIAQTHEGDYTCKAHHRSRKVITGFSNTVNVIVHDRNPAVKLTRNPEYKVMFTRESVSFNCFIDLSSGWEYLWYKDSTQINAASVNMYQISTVGTSDTGLYKCQAKRGSNQFFKTESSQSIHLEVQETPVPSLEQSTQWLDVFPHEPVNLTCGIKGSSDWMYTWYKDGQQIQADKTVSFDLDKTSLSISSASPSHRGQYSCRGQLKRSSVISKVSLGLTLDVYDRNPAVKLTRNPEYKVMFTRESVSFNCFIDLSSGWEYLWYKDSTQINAASVNMYQISTVGTSDTGLYKCQAKRGSNQFFKTESSQSIPLEVQEIPVPSLKQKTQWLDVFPTESLILSCEMANHSGWTYTWYKDGPKVHANDALSFDSNGATLSIRSASTKDKGGYTCEGHLKDRPVTSRSTSTLRVTVYDRNPAVKLTRNPEYKVMFTGESVSFKCSIDLSSGWEYLWYKDSTQINAASVNMYQISTVGTSDTGLYKCQAKRGSNQFFKTESSQSIHLEVQETPVPSLEQSTQWLDVFPHEPVNLTCGIKGSSDWMYTWYKDGQQIQADKTVSFDLDKTSLSISSASPSHRGQYSCRGQLKRSSVISKVSLGLTLDVYDAEPTVTLIQTPEHRLMHTGDSVSFSCHINVSSGWEYLWYKNGTRLPVSGSNHTISPVKTADTGSYTCSGKRGRNADFSSNHSLGLGLDIEERPQANIDLLTGWSEVFSTDSLVLRCQVQKSQDMWNYTWFKEGQPITLPPSEKYIVTPQNDPEQSLYTCQGIRTGRPSYSKPSDTFKTKNLLVKRRVLLSISGFIFFAIIAVIIGFTVLRVIRKPEDDGRPEEANLFLTNAELRNRFDVPCPMVEYITDAELNAPAKEEGENGMLCSETTPLPITSPDNEAVTTENHDKEENNGGLVSFKQ